MLEHIFGSKTRAKLLKIFFKNVDGKFFIRQLARDTRSQLNSIRREVANLQKIGIIIPVDENDTTLEKSAKSGQKDYQEKMKKYYAVNQDFALFDELRYLILKAQMFVERGFIKKIESTAKLYLLILTGGFIGNTEAKTDMLIVGSVNKGRLSEIISNFERELGREINYTVMSRQEYTYRVSITDRFLYDILEGKKIVVMDKLRSADTFETNGAKKE